MGKTLSLFIIVLTLISFASAWDTCASDCTQETAACGAYTDTNNDNICDHGQKNPNEIPSTSKEISLSIPVVEDSHDLISGQDLKTKTVKEVAQIYQISQEDYAKELSNLLDITVSPNHHFQTLHDNYKLNPAEAKEIALGIKTQSKVMSEQKVNTKDYYTIPLILITIILYFTTLFLTKKKKLSLRNHRKIWNILLMGAFLGTGILGILLTINLEFGLGITLPFSMLKWHVLIGIPSVVISFFHIFWHMPYLKKMFNFN